MGGTRGLPIAASVVNFQGGWQPLNDWRVGRVLKDSGGAPGLVFQSGSSYSPRLIRFRYPAPNAGSPSF